MLSEAVSKAKRGLKVVGLALAGITKRPPGRPGSPLAMRGEGGSGWAGPGLRESVLPQPARTSTVAKQAMRERAGAVIVMGFLLPD